MSSNLFATFPEFSLGNILLIEIDPLKHATDFLSYMTHPQVAAFIAQDDLPTDNNSAYRELNYWASLFKQHRSFYWGILEQNSNKLIGTIGFNSYSSLHQKCEISYDLDYAFWGQGIMHQALQQVIAFAYTEMKATRIQATVAINNHRSIKLLEKLGFVREGLLQKYVNLHGTLTDYYIYALVK